MCTKKKKKKKIVHLKNIFLEESSLIQKILMGGRGIFQCTHEEVLKNFYVAQNSKISIFNQSAKQRGKGEIFQLISNFCNHMSEHVFYII